MILSGFLSGNGSHLYTTSSKTIFIHRKKVYVNYQHTRDKKLVYPEIEICFKLLSQNYPYAKNIS